MHEADIELILSHRHDNGADYWATEDGRIYDGNPFSTIGSLLMPDRGTAHCIPRWFKRNGAR